MAIPEDVSAISSGAALSADGRQIAVRYYDNSVVEWDLNTGQVASRSSPTQSVFFVSSLIYIPNSNRIGDAR